MGIIQNFIQPIYNLFPPYFAGLLFFAFILWVVFTIAGVILSFIYIINELKRLLT